MAKNSKVQILQMHLLCRTFLRLMQWTLYFLRHERLPFSLLRIIQRNMFIVFVFLTLSFHDTTWVKLLYQSLSRWDGPRAITFPMRLWLDPLHPLFLFCFFLVHGAVPILSSTEVITGVSAVLPRCLPVGFKGICLLLRVGGNCDQGNLPFLQCLV